MSVSVTSTFSGQKVLDSPPYGIPVRRYSLAEDITGDNSAGVINLSLEIPLAQLLGFWWAIAGCKMWSNSAAEGISLAIPDCRAWSEYQDLDPTQAIAFHLFNTDLEDVGGVFVIPEHKRLKPILLGKWPQSAKELGLTGAVFNMGFETNVDTKLYRFKLAVHGYRTYDEALHSVQHGQGAF